MILADIHAWRAQGLRPQLVGRVYWRDGVYEASVQPELFAEGHPFYLAHGRTKAISVQTDLMGDFTIVGGASSPYGTAAGALKDFEHILRVLSCPGDLGHGNPRR